VTRGRIERLGLRLRGRRLGNLVRRRRTRFRRVRLAPPQPPAVLGGDPDEAADQRAPDRVGSHPPGLPSGAHGVDDAQAHDARQARRGDRLECRCLLLGDLLRAQAVSVVVLHPDERGVRDRRDVEMRAHLVVREVERIRHVVHDSVALRELGNRRHDDRRVVGLREQRRRRAVRRRDQQADDRSHGKPDEGTAASERKRRADSHSVFVR
jgi:hypothetical protein